MPRLAAVDTPEMALPQPQPDDDALVASILREIPEVVEEQKVRSLLSAWWRYAGVRVAAGAVVDSERFLAERGSLGLLELPVVLARSVIELEFALLHGAGAEGPERRAERTLNIVPPVAATPAPEPAAIAEAFENVPVAMPPPPLVVVSEPPPEPASVLTADPWPETPRLPAAVPVSAFERFRRDRRGHAAAAAATQYRVMAGLVVFFSLAIGCAVVAADLLPSLPFPGGHGSALAGPRLGLGGLTVTGLGVLGGSALTAGLGAAVLVVGAAFGTRRQTA